MCRYRYIDIGTNIQHGLPRWFNSKESACQCRRLRRHVSIPGSGRSPGVGNGNPLQYSCLGKIPWTEEPGGLQFVGLQRIGHDLAMHMSMHMQIYDTDTGIYTDTDI